MNALALDTNIKIFIVKKHTYNQNICEKDSCLKLEILPQSFPCKMKQIDSHATGDNCNAIFQEVLFKMHFCLLFGATVWLRKSQCHVCHCYCNDTQHNSVTFSARETLALLHVLTLSACHTGYTPSTACKPMKMQELSVFPQSVCHLSAPCMHLSPRAAGCVVRALGAGLHTCMADIRVAFVQQTPEGERAANITVNQRWSQEREERAWLPRSAPGLWVKMMWTTGCISAWSTSSRWRTSPSTSSTSLTPSPCSHAPCSASCTSRLRGEWRTTPMSHKEPQWRHVTIATLHRAAPFHIVIMSKSEFSGF